MATLREFLKPPPPSMRLFLLRNGESASLRAAIWKVKLGRITKEFDGDTSEAAEDRALDVLLHAETGNELLFFTRELTWECLADELDEPDIDEICSHLRRLLDRRNYLAASILEGLFGDPSNFADIRADELTSGFDTWFTKLTLAGRRDFAERIFALRDSILDSIGLRVMRGLPTFARELRVVIDRTSALGDQRVAELALLSFEVFYADRIGSQIESGEYSLLLTTLPDLVDPSLPADQRQACFDMLRRWDQTFAAMQEIINTVGTARQQGDMRRFMEVRRVFLDNFTPNPPTPGIIADIAAFLGEFTDSINGLRAALQDTVSDIAGLISLGSLLGTIDDDEARNVVAALRAQEMLDIIPFDYKAQLINRLTDGSTGDDDELAILHILRVTRDRSPAELLQLVVAGRFELLDFSLDGAEHDQLMNLLGSV